MMDPVRELMVQRRCSEEAVRDGLDGLVRRWEAVARSMLRGEPQEQDSYRNDVDGRDIIEAALAVAGPAARERFANRVHAADQVIRAHSIPIPQSIWGADVARRFGYVPDRQWWFFHRPEALESPWQDSGSPAV